jgi:uncharacterized membrane protein YraQ (UPF0718 family)
MSPTSPTSVVLPPRRAASRYRFLVVLTIAVVGLFIVKWYPYFYKAHRISLTHSMGANVLFFKGITAPSPSISAALGYAGSYFNAVWQAWVLGLLLAATIETVLPRNWLARLLGKASARTSLLGGVLALPGMM